MRAPRIRQALATFIAAGCFAGAIGAAERPQSLAIRIDNLSDVPGRDLGRAIEEAGRLFRLIGVHVTWTQLKPNAANPPSDLVVALIDRDQLPERFCSAGALGVASHLPDDPGHAFIFFERVKRVADRRSDPGMLLGFVLAHEVGHLLLPPGFHSRNGIMRGHWVMNDLKPDTAFLLQFSDREAALIHDRVAALAQTRLHTAD